MKTKTAIRQLIEQIDEELKSAVLVPYRNALHNTKALALKLESVNEQQIKDAYLDGDDDRLNGNKRNHNEYFTDNFEKP